MSWIELYVSDGKIVNEYMEDVTAEVLAEMPTEALVEELERRCERLRVVLGHQEGG